MYICRKEEQLTLRKVKLVQLTDAARVSPSVRSFRLRFTLQPDGTELTTSAEHSTSGDSDLSFPDSALTFAGVPIDRLESKRVEVAFLAVEGGATSSLLGLPGRSPKASRKSTGGSGGVAAMREVPIGATSFKPDFLLTCPRTPHQLRLQLNEPGREPAPSPGDLMLSLSYLPTAQRLTVVLMRARRLPTSINGGTFATAHSSAALSC